MKQPLKLISFFLTAIFYVSCGADKGMNEGEALENGFVIPPDSIQTSVYWYWISDNISEEGVVKDLHSMKEAGINRAFIGNIGLDDVPYGEVKMLSEEWWAILHTALKTATELNIEIGIFNSPGWSQSGGPWVKPEEAMRYLTISEMQFKGPQQISQKLEKPADVFQDVKLIAYPAPENDQLIVNRQNGNIRSEPSVPGLYKIVDGNPETGINLPGGEQFIIDFETEEPFTARSLSIRTTKTPVHANAELLVKDGEEFSTLSGFEINRSNPSLNVGFEPYAPITVSFPAITASHFRLIVKNAGEDTGLAEVELAAAPRVENFSEKTLAKMHQTPLPYWDDYLWRNPPEVDDKSFAINASRVVDISENLSEDGTLNWDVPEGEWVIMRTGMTPTGTKNSPASPEATGYEVDKMSKEHVKKHFFGHMGEVLERIPEEDRKCFKVVVQDSYETGGQNFTDGFLEKFKQKYGYDPLPYLPVYQGKVVNSQQESDRFLWDMRRLVADMVAYDYVAGLRDVSHEHGLTTWLENYGHWGFPGEFLMYGGQSDEIAGEFWSEGELGDIENRAATSCGHIYGINKISAESNTCGGRAYSRYPATIKQRGDRFFAEGINNTLLHVFISQPYEDKKPGVNAPFGNEFNRKNTWFSQIDVYLKYLKRVNFMLQQGLNVADVAYFIGEDTPKMTGVTDPPLPVGYQFDYMNAEVIEKYMTVENGLLTLPHGTQYKILVLPELETMRPEVLKKIKQLVFDGGVILGPSPKRSPSLQNQPEADEEVKALASELWGEVDGTAVKAREFGAGRVLNGMEMQEALDLINCMPDCKLPEENTIHYGHRTLENAEIYFVTNQANETQDVIPEFRVTNLQPELWDATTGKIRNLPGFEQKENSTAVPLKLEPFESAFIVFRKKAGKPLEGGIRVNYPDANHITQLNSPWMVRFDPSQRGPENHVVFDTLRSWTTFSDDRIKYYSGTAVYSNRFQLDQITEEEKVILDLGSLTAMAKIFVNGNSAGAVWTAPYKLDITPWVKQGTNDLQVEVVNTWINRLIGDQNLPEKARQTWSPVNPYTADSPLQSSGLLGPVTISSVEYY